MVAVLRGLGLHPVVVAFASTRPEGTVLFTAPDSDVGVAPGSSVNVVISSGKTMSRPDATGE
jgi:beta-lactam-binding protein with PASTA domain